jgi:2-polyprenyl-3-methyl-5-hydroxy-6-metoxy-1,4-benzoquinol methylase
MRSIKNQSLIDPRSGSQTRVTEALNDNIVRGIHKSKHKYLIPFISGKKILDTGCGAGFGLKILSPYYREAVGIDGHAESIKLAQSYDLKKTSFFKVKTLENFSLSVDQFDVVLSIDVLQQIEYTELYLDQVKRHMSPDGLFIIITPNIKKTMNVNQCHYREYSIDTLKNELSTKFEVLSISGMEKNDGSARLRKLQKLDLFKLRRFSPRFFSKFIRNLLQIPIFDEIDVSHYPVTSDLANAYSFFSVCRLKN